MAGVVDSPDQIAMGPAVQRRRVGERRDVLTDLFGLGVVVLELQPAGFPRQAA